MTSVSDLTTTERKEPLATPNQMPRKPKPSKLKQQLVAALIETQPASWNRRVWVRNEDDLLEEKTVKVTHQALKWPLAQNISAQNVEALAQRWLQ